MAWCARTRCHAGRTAIAIAMGRELRYRTVPDLTSDNGICWGATDATHARPRFDYHLKTIWRLFDDWTTIWRFDDDDGGDDKEWEAVDKAQTSPVPSPSPSPSPSSVSCCCTCVPEGVTSEYMSLIFEREPSMVRQCLLAMRPSPLPGRVLLPRSGSNSWE